MFPVFSTDTAGLLKQKTKLGDHLQIAINERLIAQARDHREKALIGYDTANVMQELADS